MGTGSFRITISQERSTNTLLRSPLRWSFEISVPNKFLKGAYILVKPIRHPRRAYWAGIERQSINFARATKGSYRGRVYARLHIADATGEKNKIGISKGERYLLAIYIRKFGIRPTQTVTSTAWMNWSRM